MANNTKCVYYNCDDSNLFTCYNTWNWLSALNVMMQIWKVICLYTLQNKLKTEKFKTTHISNL